MIIIILQRYCEIYSKYDIHVSNIITSVTFLPFQEIMYGNKIQPTNWTSTVHRKVTLPMINVIHPKILHSGVAMDIILNFIQESNIPVLLTFGDKFIETQRSPIKLRLTARGQSKELFFRNQVYAQLTLKLQDSR